MKIILYLLKVSSKLEIGTEVINQLQLIEQFANSTLKSFTLFIRFKIFSKTR